MAKTLGVYTLTTLVMIVSLWPIQPAHPHDPVPARDLEQKIAWLKEAVAEEPTTGSNVAARLETFWQWANSYALAGLPIDPDVPATVARIRDPGPVSAVSALDLADIDRWVREFSYRQSHPKAIGSLTSPELSGFTVDAHHTLVLNYTVGERALGEGDGFVLGELTYGSGPMLQARNPRADNFVSISSDTDAEFIVETYPIRGMFSGTMKRSVVMSGPAEKVFFRVAKGRLPTGSTVTITLGDQALGSKGLGLIAPSIDALRFRVWLHLETEQLLMTLPEVQFASVGGPAAGVRGFAPSVVAVGEPFDVTVRFEDQFRNLAQGRTPAAVLTNGRRVIARIAANNTGVVTVPDVVLQDEGIHRLTIQASALAATADVNPILVQHKPARRLYWGETHGHSGFSEGMGSVDGVYRFARDQARLDFMALTEHDYWMDDAEWEVLRAAAQKYNEPGKFLAFLAYEWTVHAAHGGHHNIIFRTPEGRRRVPRQSVQTLAQLYQELGRVADEEDVLIIPHAHNPGDWTQNDPAVEKFVEIVSLHGTFEWFGRRYLDQGFMVGFLGGSDDHVGHPGIRPLRRNPTSDNFGGLLGLYATEKSTDAVFDAMRNIQGYATNGNRAILAVELNGKTMGTFLPPAATAVFKGAVHGTAPIEEIVLIKNGRMVLQQDYAADATDSEYVEVRFWSDSYPRYKGALARQWRRWRGSLLLSGGKLVEISSPQNDNPFTEFLAPRAGEPNIADFFLKTRGSYKSILLKINQQSDDVRLRLRGVKESPLPGEPVQTFNFDISLSGLAGRTERLDIETQGYDDHILVRAVQRPEELDIALDFEHSQPMLEGDYFYLRIRQSDGGLIWSSPFRVLGTDITANAGAVGGKDAGE